MESELNVLTFDNTSTTFTPSTNNTATSDELSAPAIYENGKETLYAKNKKVSKGTTIVLIALSASAVLATGGSILSNVFVGDPPSISETRVMEVVEGSDVLHYEFEVTNKRSYKTTLYVTVAKTNVFTLDISKPGEYVGDTGHLGFGVNGTYKVIFSNSIDYRQTIWTGTFEIPAEGE